MNAPINDGGPAFPCQPLDAQGNPCNAAQDGMSLRDWFAGQALQGYLAAFADASISFPKETKAASMAYAYADAMLAARKEKP